MEEQVLFHVSGIDVHPSSQQFPLTQPSSHHSRTPTTRKGRGDERISWLRHDRRASTANSKLLCLLIFLTCCISLTSATSYYIDEEMVEEREVEPLESTFARLARSGTILVDQSPPPIPVGEWSEDPVPESNDHDLKPRDGTNSSSSASTANTTLKTSISSSATAAASTTVTSIPADTTASASPLPSPFDIGFSGNITSDCQSFMNSMLSNATFKTCLPFSLLLQNSASFFQVEKSLVRVTQTLDYSCAANVTECSNLMSAFASNLTTSDACASDLSSENPLVQQAHLGLLAYKPLYSASCLRDPATSAYCFAEAITNASNSADSYIYFLPLNISLVGGSQPTCDTCLKNTMAIFEAATADRSSALASDYVSAATQVNVNCGPTFVNASLAAAAVSSASTRATHPGNMGLFTLVLVLASWLLL